MLFLLNDAVIQIESELVDEALTKTGGKPLRFDTISRMGQ